jgi:CRP-like cAMP-binding protein
MAKQLNPVPAPAHPDGTAYAALFEARGWLSDKPPGFRRQLLQMGRLITVARGEWVFAIGDPPGGIYGVISGGIGIEGAGPFHMLRLGHVVRAGTWFGHHPILHPGGRRTQGMRAMEESQLLHVPLAPLEALVKADAVAARAVGNMADGGSILATRIISDLLIPDATQRVAAVLLRVTGAEDGVEPTHPDGFLMTQSELGEMANVSRPHVNRMLGELEERGWIAKRYQRLRILDVAALRNFAASDA